MAHAKAGPLPVAAGPRGGNAGTTRTRPSTSRPAPPCRWSARPANGTAPTSRRTAPQPRAASQGGGRQPGPGNAPAGGGTAVLALYTALHDVLVNFQPDEGTDLIRHMKEHAVGFLHVTEGFEAMADNLATETGLDPGFVAGVIELAEAISAINPHVAMAVQKFLNLYGGVRQDIAAGLVMPHRGRFLTGEDV